MEAPGLASGPGSDGRGVGGPIAYRSEMLAKVGLEDLWIGLSGHWPERGSDDLQLQGLESFPAMQRLSEMRDRRVMAVASLVEAIAKEADRRDVPVSIIGFLPVTHRDARPPGNPCMLGSMGLDPSIALRSPFQRIVISPLVPAFPGSAASCPCPQRSNGALATN